MAVWTPERIADRYLVGDQIGRGGMGAVYLAQDERRGRKVAIKVLASRRAQDTRFCRLFLREIRAVARLRHPGVVHIYDYGFSEQAGFYYVMEYIEGGSMRSRPAGVWDWLALRALFVQLLETLAYAHARGIIHRDIKPDNILLSESEGQTRVKLVDFGIAKLTGDARSDASIDEESGDGVPMGNRAIGTPAYMAPEQVQAAGHLIGPASDLYSLGCVLFELVAGESPFMSPSRMGTLLKHINAPVPSLRERFGEGIPESLDTLLRDLLAKDPRHRPFAAADVARRLEEIGPFPMPSLARGTAVADTASEPPPISDERMENDTTDVEEADFFSTWSAIQAPSDHQILAPDPLSGADTNVGMLWLREPGLVGRNVQMARLIALAELVAAQGGVRVVALQGEAGVGKTRLARSLGELMVERGRFKVLHVGYDGQGDALRLALLRDLGGVPGVSGAGLSALGALVGERVGLASLGRFLDGEPGDGGVAVLGDVAKLRQRMTLQTLDIARRGKPLLLVLDGDGWADSEDVAALLGSWLRDGPAPFPALVLVTQGEPAPRGVAEAMLRGATEPHLERLALTRLDEVEALTLAESLLPLRPEAAALLVSHAGGNPRWLLEVIRDWASRGLLYESDNRFWVLEDAAETPPKSLERLWQQRLETIGSRYAEGPWLVRVLLVAGLMGANLDVAMIEDILARSEQMSTAKVQAALEFWVRQGVLAERGRDDLSFENGLLHGCVRRVAASRSSAEAWHRLIAEVAIERTTPSARPMGPGAIGTHLHRVRDKRAFVWLVDGVQRAWSVGRSGRASELTALALDVLSWRGVPESEARRTTLAICMGELGLRRAEPEMVGRAIRLLLQRARSSPSGIETAWVIWFQAELLYKSGELEEAVRHLHIAIESFQRMDRTGEELRARSTLAHIYRLRGQYALSEDQCLAALALARTHHLERAEAQMLSILAFIHLETASYTRAQTYAEYALLKLRHTHDDWRRAEARKILTGALLRQGLFDKALEMGQQCLAQYRHLGDQQGELAMLNILAMVYQDMEVFTSARNLGLEALGLSERLDERALRGRLLNNLALACQALGRDDEARRRFSGAVIWSRRADDIQNEARSCFNLARFLMRRRTDHALLLAERARRLLEPIGLAYVAQCEALVAEASGKLEPKVVGDNMQAYEVLIEALYASLIGAMT